MGITMDQAVQTVHKPERINCLQCHAKAGGGDNNKRGDIALAHSGTTDRNFDVHMSTTGANLACQKCHTTEGHKIAGRGSDLRQTDLDVPMNCSTSECHPNKLSSTGHVTADVNRHVNKIACQTCHIGSYARNASDTVADESTEIRRDWTTPEWNATAKRWEPKITRGSNIIPVYRFWNRFSYAYNLGEIATLDPVTGAYPTSRPVGGINDPQSKLYPFKYKRSNYPLATNLSKLIPMDTAVYWATGDWIAATKKGLLNMGLSETEPYTMVETDTYQLITHEVQPASQALTCNACHGSTATHMNLKSMGYVLKGPASSICSSCHSYKDPTTVSYITIHKKHVTDKKYDCSKCHDFTRAESAPPPTSGDYTLTISKSGTGSGTVTSSPSGISCGTDCSEKYNQGSTITLTATASNGSIFKGWGGACSGTGNCVVTVNANATITAVFDKITTTTGPDIYLKITSLDFGNVGISSTKERSLRVFNKGNSDLKISKMEITGTNANMFKINSSKSFTVKPGGSHEIRIRFTPASRGDKSAKLNIYSNDADTSVLPVILKGKGI